MEKLIVVASLGCVRPLEFQESGDDPVEQDHLIEEAGRMIEIKHENLSAVVSDQSGRFTQSAPLGRNTGMSYGEDHNLETEREKHALNYVASEIGKIVAAEAPPAWRLIAPKELLPSLSQALPPTARQSLATTEAGDLTKLPIKELEKRILKRH